MSEDLLTDWIMESYDPAEGDRERLRLSVYACVRAHERRDVENLGEEIG